MEISFTQILQRTHNTLSRELGILWYFLINKNPRLNTNERTGKNSFILPISVAHTIRAVGYLFLAKPHICPVTVLWLTSGQQVDLFHLYIAVHLAVWSFIL